MIDISFMVNFLIALNGLGTKSAFIDLTKMLVSFILQNKKKNLPAAVAVRSSKVAVSIPSFKNVRDQQIQQCDTLTLILFFGSG
jgi:hypothetical protein